MKKILLSCVTCLLALGLVTACNNEEEDVSGGDGATQESGGDTTQGGGTTATTLSNYTLSFTFTYGGETVLVPDYATAYISYGKVGQSWGGLMALTVTDAGAYTITLDSVEATTYEYKIVLCYVDATPDWSHELTTTNQSFTVEASQGDGYILDITITSSKPLTDVITDPTIAPRTNYTLEFTLTTPLVEGNSLYLIGSFNGWNEEDWCLCTYDDTKGVYTYTFDSIAVDSYTYKGVSCVTGSPSYGYTDEDQAWQSYAVIHDGNDGNATLVVSASDKVDGHVKEILVNADGTVDSEDSGEIIEEGVHFYVAFIDCDTESGKVVSSLDGSFYFEASAYTTEDTGYTRVNNPNIWSGTNYCNATQVASSDSRVVLYSEEAIAVAEDELWIDVNNGSHWMSQGSSPVEIPTDDTATYVCVIPAWFYGWLDDATNPSWSGDSMNWHTLEEGQTIADFVSALTLETATASEGEDD